jgi:hypothetical protein
VTFKPSTRPQADDQDELLARLVEAMGENVNTWDAAGAMGRLMSIFASRMNDKDFEFWIGLVRESRKRYIEQHLKEQLDGGGT